MAITFEKRMRIYERDGFRCCSCGYALTRERVLEITEHARENFGRFPRSELLTLDHIWPKALGGSSRDQNLQTLCARCNQRKGCAVPSRPTRHPKAKPYKRVKLPERRERQGRLIVKPLGSATLHPFAEAVRRLHLPDCDPTGGCVADCPVPHLTTAETVRH